MLLIGLAGATAAERDQVAYRMAESGLTRVSVYANYSPALRYPHAAAQRADKIRALASVTTKGTDCLVFSQVMSLEEAELLRKFGADIWHIEGVPSMEVPIRKGDLLVTPTPGGHRHYLDPVEALSEAILKAKAAGKKVTA